MKKIRVVLSLLLCFFVSLNHVVAQWTPVHEPAPVAAMYKYKGAFFAAQNGIYKSDTNTITWTRKKMWLDNTPINVQTGKMWQEIDTLYANVTMNEYGSLFSENVIRSKDNGENWTVLKKFPKGTLLNFNTDQMTVLNSKTYLTGYFSDDINQDSSGLLKRNCDTCAWKLIPGIKKVTFSRALMTRINNKIFIKYDHFSRSLYSLYRLENDSLILAIDSIFSHKNFIEKSDTLFMSIRKGNYLQPISHLISANQGKTWTAMPPQYKLPDFDLNLPITRVGDIYYYYSFIDSRYFKSNDLIKWDTLPLGHPYPNLIYSENNKQYFSGTAGIAKINSEGAFISENSGFLADYNQVAVNQNLYPAGYDFVTGVDESLLLNGTRSTNGGLTWQAIGKPLVALPQSIYGTQFLRYDAFKIKNKYYCHVTKNLYILKDSVRFEWAKIDTLLDVTNTKQVWNDTLFTLRDNKSPEYSVDFGKTWRFFSPNQAFQSSNGSSSNLYRSGNYTYANYYGNYYYSTNNINWTKISTSFMDGNSINFFDKDVFEINTNNRDISILTKYYQLGASSKVLTAHPLFKLKKIENTIIPSQPYNRAYVIMKNKIFLVTKERSKIFGKLRYEVFQSDTSGNDWVKVFEAPNYRPIGAILDRGDSLYVSVGLRENIFDTTASIYKSAVADLDKNHNRGMVYWDKNRNQIFDSTDIALANYVIQSKNDYTLTNTLGQYTFYTPTFGDTLKPIAPKKYMTSIPPYYLTTAIDTPRRFAIQAPEFQDLYISLATPSVFRPGFGTNLTLTAQNRGLKAVNTTVKLVLDNKLTYVQSNPIATRVGDTLTWAIGVLNIDESKDINLQVKTSTTTALGTTIAMSASVLPIEQDSAKADNYANLNATVIGSYDPNDKLVEPKTLTPEDVAKGSPINYTIRFQNTGTAAATFVAVEDTLADYFDLSTFRFIASSHNCTYEYKGRGIIRFVLDNINLPAAISNEEGSHGFVKFSIYPKTSLKRGDSVFNKAFIYFDYNSAIITPTAKLPIQTPTHVWEAPKITEQLKIYPNPAYEQVTLEISDTQFEGGVLSLYDITGRLLFMKSVSSKIEDIDIEFLKTGEYICILQAKNEKVYVNKFLKVK